ncbi:hypothetical protein AB0M87_19270 [Streptomyces sp. NPDC051320]|uniref:hypothetical protein n=1 Tax=Streptomyces sp. NPDC051320 TaxID=3154644 RepID=UPI003447842E
MTNRLLGRLAVSCDKLKLTGYASHNGLDWAGQLHGCSHRAEVDALYRGAGLSLDADLGTLHAAPAYHAEQAATRWMQRTSTAAQGLDVPLRDIHTATDFVDHRASRLIAR